MAKKTITSPTISDFNDDVKAPSPGEQPVAADAPVTEVAEREFEVRLDGSYIRAIKAESSEDAINKFNAYYGIKATDKKYTVTEVKG